MFHLVTVRFVNMCKNLSFILAALSVVNMGALHLWHLHSTCRTMGCPRHQRWDLMHTSVHASPRNIGQNLHNLYALTLALKWRLKRCQISNILWCAVLKCLLLYWNSVSVSVRPSLNLVLTMLAKRHQKLLVIKKIYTCWSLAIRYLVALTEKVEGE